MEITIQHCSLAGTQRWTSYSACVVDQAPLDSGFLYNYICLQYIQSVYSCTVEVFIIISDKSMIILLSNLRRASNLDLEL